MILNPSLPDKKEIKDTIKEVKNHKSPVLDALQAEGILIKTIHKLILPMWQEERMPEDQNMGIICPLHMKGDKMDRGNYRDIILLPCAYRILPNILFGRLVPGRYRS